MGFSPVSFVLRSLALACALTVTPSMAEVDALVREAQALASAGEGAKAYTLLEPHELNRAGDPDFDLALGIAANEAKQYTRAILALERLLALQPGNTRARVELGRALYGVGDVRTARALLAEGKLEGIPAVAGEPIDQLLHAIDRIEAAGKSSYRAYLEAAVGHDTNINGAPGVSSVAVPAFGGSIVAINPAGSRREGAYASVGAGASGRLVLDPRWSLIGSVNGASRHQTGGNRAVFDTFQINGNAGISYRVERHELSLAGQFGIYDIDHDRVRDLYGVVGEWTYRFDGFRQLNAFVQLTELEYPKQPISDSQRRVVGITYAHLFPGGVWAYGGAYAGEEAVNASGVDHLGHKLAGLRGGVQYSITGALAVFVTAGYEERHFGGTDPLFLIGRRDDQVNASLGLSWVPANFWRVTPQISYTNTRSNVPIAAYDKREFSVTVRRDF